jgi:hypothetical protein
VLWPLILFINGIVHGEFTNLNQEPVLITFSAFNRDIRNKAQAWIPIAYEHEGESDSFNCTE